MRLTRHSVERSVQDWEVWAKNHRDSLTTKYGGTPSARSSSDIAKRGSGTNLIVNQNADSTYFGSLAVGDPPVAFDVILDTGSA
jgi:cathepsin D